MTQGGDKRHPLFFVKVQTKKLLFLKYVFLYNDTLE
jgi:hypothetical protein